MKQLIEVFYAPGKVFDYVRERKAWVIATLANALLVSFTIWFMYQTIGAENMARHQFENSKFAAQMSDDQKQQAIAAAGQGHRNYAKRQLTWFRREPGVHWLTGFGDDLSIQTEAESLVAKGLYEAKE